jgi:tetratricopeptide (TPR) repeat protein
LGLLYRDQGKLAEAEEMYVRALGGFEKALGAEHTLTLTTVNNLGNLYRDQGKLAEAEILFRRATQARATFLGPEQTGKDGMIRQPPRNSCERKSTREHQKPHQTAVEEEQEMNWSHMN